MVINSDVNIYGNKLANTASFDVKSKNKLKPYGFSFPVSNKGGGYLKRSSGLELVKNNLKQLLLTNRGERVMLPNYGTNLREYLMEPLDQALFSQIRREIIESISKYARNVNLLKIQIIPGDTPTQSGGHHLFIKLYCQLVEEDNVSFEIKVELF